MLVNNEKINQFEDDEENKMIIDEEFKEND